MQMSVEEYLDQKCNIPLLSIFKELGFLSRESIGSLPNTKKIDLTLVRATVTPTGEGVADLLNSHAWCGINNWQTGKPVDVVGRICCKGELIPAGKLGYSIYSIQDDTLLLGQESGALDGSSEEKRPNALSNVGLTR